MPRIHDPIRKRRGSGTMGMMGDPSRGFNPHKDKPYWPEYPGEEHEKPNNEEEKKQQQTTKDNNNTEKSDAEAKSLKKKRTKKKKRLSCDNFMDDQEFSLSNKHKKSASLTPKLSANNDPKQQNLPLVTPASTAFQELKAPPESRSTDNHSKSADTEETVGQPTASQEPWESPHPHSQSDEASLRQKQSKQPTSSTGAQDGHSKDAEQMEAEQDIPVQELWKSTHPQSPTTARQQAEKKHDNSNTITQLEQHNQELAAALQKLLVECSEKDKVIQELREQQALTEKQREADIQNAIQETQSRLQFRFDQDQHYQQQQIRLLKQEAESAKEELETVKRANLEENAGHQLQIQEMKQTISDLTDGQRQEHDTNEQQQQELESTTAALEATQTKIQNQQQRIAALERRQLNWEQRERALIQREASVGIAHSFPSQTSWWGQQQQHQHQPSSQPNGENLRILNLLQVDSRGGEEEEALFSAPNPPEQPLPPNLNTNDHQQHHQQQQQLREKQMQGLNTPSTVGGSPPLASNARGDLTFDSSKVVACLAADKAGNPVKAQPLQLRSCGQKNHRKRELKDLIPSYDFCGLDVIVPMKRRKKLKTSKRVVMETPTSP